MEKKVVGFKLKGEEFAFDIMNVIEIIRLKEITPVPTAPDFIEGVINLRGKIIPIIDLRKRFNLAVQQRTKKYRIIIVEQSTVQYVGVIVDEVSQVITVKDDEIMPPPPTLVSVGGRYIDAIVQREDGIIVFLDIHKVFSKEEKDEMSEVVEAEVSSIEKSTDS